MWIEIDLAIYQRGRQHVGRIGTDAAREQPREMLRLIWSQSRLQFSAPCNCIRGLWMSAGFFYSTIKLAYVHF